jgi:hypothetical protein
MAKSPSKLLKLPIGFEEALGDLLKVKPPPKDEKPKRKVKTAPKKRR